MIKLQKGSWQDAKKNIRKKSSSSHDEEDIVVGCWPGKRLQKKRHVEHFTYQVRLLRPICFCYV